MPEQERQTSLRLHHGDWSSTDLNLASRADVLGALRSFAWVEEWQRAKAAAVAGEAWSIPTIQIGDDAGYALFVRVMQDDRVALHYEYPTRENRFGFQGNDGTASLNAADAPPDTAEQAVNLFFDANETELLQLLERYRVVEENDTQQDDSRNDTPNE